MSKRKKCFLVFSFILFDIALVVGILVLRDATMYNKLIKEVNELLELNILKDRYNSDLTTKGSYAIVEKSMKEYLDKSAVEVQDIMSFIQDSKFTKILSYDNYLVDAPSFQNSLNYLKEEKVNINKKIDSVLESIEEKSIKEYILTKTNDSRSIDLYNHFMVEESFKTKFQELREGLIRVREVINNNIDVSNNVLLFLINNQKSWKLENGEIQFFSQEKYDEYAKLISTIKSK